MKITAEEVLRIEVAELRAQRDELLALVSKLANFGTITARPLDVPALVREAKAIIDEAKAIVARLRGDA